VAEHRERCERRCVRGHRSPEQRPGTEEPQRTRDSIRLRHRSPRTRSEARER
jgi:hypothetical protein